ncbi:ribosome hibernation-promoting factor, HPF/YfiA family [Streptomyces cavernicola]|uniref:Ribosome-associated translation inhibitor RaiA n=1 Tax=Streptomyces cavernicola TaxID=3043613 RepID=A0ABT6SL37_9ACTN|nr:ribosome-associated translation inhibitor RaiA [Streptomyces sp. B-S-A6]MDI3408906.1 ribosome-associated translation inhibitor RaiA [Streptomyces sp. B-S-A6]
MEINVTFRHMTGTDVIRRGVEERVAALQQHLPRTGTSAEVTLSTEGGEFIAEVALAAGDSRYYATERNHDMYQSIDRVVSTLESKITSGTKTTRTVGRINVPGLG